MYPSKNTRSVPNSSTETTTLAPAPTNSSYVTQTDFKTTVKDLMDDFKESIKEIISDQDTKSVKKTEEGLHTISLHIKRI